MTPNLDPLSSQSLYVTMLEYEVNRNPRMQSYDAFIHESWPGFVFQLSDAQLESFAMTDSHAKINELLPFSQEPGARKIKPSGVFWKMNIYRDRYESRWQDARNYPDYQPRPPQCGGARRMEDQDAGIQALHKYLTSPENKDKPLEPGTVLELGGSHFQVLGSPGVTNEDIASFSTRHLAGLASSQNEDDATGSGNVVEDP